jgi:hypothetical protein
MGTPIDERLIEFERYILENVSADMVFDTMNKYLKFETMYRPLNNSHFDTFIQNELVSCIFVDFFMDVYNDCEDPWARGDVLQGTFRERVIELSRTSTSPAYDACMKILQFVETDLVPLLTPERVFPLIELPPREIFRRSIVALTPAFTDLVEIYYRTYYPYKSTYSESQFVNFMIRAHLSDRHFAFIHRLGELKKQYKAGRVIGRAYRAYRVRYLIPLIAVKSITNDMIKYRPGTGIKFFEAKDFFEKQEWATS